MLRDLNWNNVGAPVLEVVSSVLHSEHCESLAKSMLLSMIIYRFSWKQHFEYSVNSELDEVSKSCCGTLTGTILGPSFGGGKLSVAF